VLGWATPNKYFMAHTAVDYNYACTAERYV